MKPNGRLVLNVYVRFLAVNRMRRFLSAKEKKKHSSTLSGSATQSPERNFSFL